MTITTQGILQVTWGPALGDALKSAASVKATNPRLPVCLVVEPAHEARANGLAMRTGVIDRVLPMPMPEANESGNPPKPSFFLPKIEAIRRSPFDKTLYLDTDTRVLGDLSFGFNRLNTTPLAAVIALKHSVGAIGPAYGVSEETVEYNAGMLFIDRADPTVSELIDHWRELTDDMRERFAWPLPVGCSQDQIALAIALERMGMHPAVLPWPWNHRPTQRGSYHKTTVWHGHDIPQAIERRLQALHTYRHLSRKVEEALAEDRRATRHKREAAPV